MSPKEKPGMIPRLDPFGPALHLLRDLLPPSNPMTKVVEGYIRQRNFSSLAELGQIEDREYQCPLEWSTVVALRQIASLFKKNDAFVDDVKCTAAAQKNFERGERICRITNRRLDFYFEHEDRVDPVLLQQLNHMQRDLESLLGDVQSPMAAMTTGIRLTNGATEDRSRKRSMPFLKITGKIRTTRASIPFVGRLLRFWGVGAASCVFECVERNVLALVPKNWKTFRTIAKEPTHTLPFQLWLDGFLKGKLRKWGIFLSTQSKNQEMARIGSIDGSIATIDLEMASDTVCLNALAWLLHPDWFQLLCCFRSAYFSAPWGDGSYAKFASMGNGLTFSVETLIFTAACRAVGSRQYAVYGDDIALETELAIPLIKLLKFLGFKTNDAKSFINPLSRFRESCGCDYSNGVLITPFYLRECPKLTDYAGMSHVLNGLVSAIGTPGHLWTWAAKVVQKQGYRLVPWNEDSRSGVFVTPNFCWRNKVLKVEKRRWIYRQRSVQTRVNLVGALGVKADPPLERIANPDWGFPMFPGYSPTQDRRETKGWRSYLLWFLEAGVEKSPQLLMSNRMSVYLLQTDSRLKRERDGTATVTSYVSERCRYVHKTRRYDPKPMLTPSHLFLWDDLLQ